MANFHAVTWQESNFERTASVLSFNSKKARTAFAAKCAQRFEDIDCRRMESFVKAGRTQRLALWDASEPTKFLFRL